MKKNHLTICILLLGALFLSCGENEDNDTGSNICDDIQHSSSINKIMPLGASRVEGARPLYESYRYELWKSLVDDGRTFDFIGTRCDEASYPSYSGRTFDQHHEGRGGITSGLILEDLEEWLALAGAPDIVLFSSPGGNDALEGLDFDEAVDNVNAIIDLLQSYNPSVSIIIEQMAPGRADSMTSELTDYFNRMNNEVLQIADEQSTANSTVMTVDMASGFEESFFADEVHYNEAGAQFIADRYLEVLEDILE